MKYADEILSKLSMHFGDYDRGSNIGKILRIFEKNDEEFLQACEDVRKILDVEQAFGDNLDLTHGKNKNLPRGSLTDEDYIQRLKLETKVNNSDGDITTLTEAGIVLFGDNFKGIKETDPATILLTLGLDNIEIPNETFERAVTAAVKVDYAASDETETLQIVIEKHEFYTLLHKEFGTFELSTELGVIL